MYNALLKGLSFTPGAGWGYAFCLPLASVFVTTMATLGLLEVGDTILDPFGDDPEDFALLHL